MEKTNLCQNSRKNHSNLQKIWRSRLFKHGKDYSALVRWQDRGFNIPMSDLAIWTQIHQPNRIHQGDKLAFSAINKI
jgi:hypothetical protein